MKERLTIVISSENKIFLKQYAALHGKSLSACVNDMLSSEGRLSNPKTKAALDDLFRGLRKVG